MIQERYEKFKQVFDEHLTRKPHISFDEFQNEVVLEYWNNKKKVTLFLLINGKVEYLKSWGHRILQDMEDGEVTSNEQLQELYK